MSHNLQVDGNVRKNLCDWDLWTGSHYELGIPFPIGSLTRSLRLRILQRIWHGPHLAGFVLRRDEMGDPWLPANEQTVQEEWFEESLHLTHYGCIQLPGGEIVGCVSTFLENQYEAWFILGIPLGMMDTVYTIHYGDIWEKDKIWTRPFDRRLGEIAARLYAEMPFEQAVLGEEASAIGERDEDFVVHTPGDYGVLLPEAVFHRFGVPPYGVPLDHGLWLLTDEEKTI